MSAFPELLRQADRLGAIEITFRVRLCGYDENDGERWTAQALLDPRIPNLCKGRSGADALKELVNFLERIRG